MELLQKRIITGLLLSTVIWLFSGCDGSGGGIGPGGGEFEMIMQTDITVLEGGQGTEVSISLRDAYGIQLNDQQIELSVDNADYPGTSIGYLTATIVTTDTLRPSGISPSVMFISDTLGQALIHANYNDDAGNILDSAQTTVNIILTLHTVTIHPTEDSVAVGGYLPFTCSLFTGGGQEDPIPAGGKGLSFSTRRNDSSGPFGVVINPSGYPVDEATTDEQGQVLGHHFYCEESGEGVLEVTYYNDLNMVAHQAQLLIKVME